MKTSGFTFVRNALKYDYPVVEAITSILPLCDELIVCLGSSDDETEQLIRSVASDKIKIIRSVWDDSLRRGGRVLAVETDKAFDAIAPDSDWALYIQADEVVHEQYLPAIRQAMEQHLRDDRVECLVLKYLHFYGSYRYVGSSRQWYRREVRVIRNDRGIRSYRDAQGFRRGGQKLNGKLVDAYVYHYGWVRNPRLLTAKQAGFEKLYNDNDSKLTVKPDELFDYSNVAALSLFEGTHPQVMRRRVAAMDWQFDFDTSKRNLPFDHRVLEWVEKYTGKRLFEFRNYKLV
jgi:glycosyltransferase involved in cell wall biosynthesis